MLRGTCCKHPVRRRFGSDAHPVPLPSIRFRFFSIDFARIPGLGFRGGMALFPPKATALAWSSVAEIVDWVGLPTDAFRAFQVITGDLGDPIRNVAMLSPTVIAEAGRRARLADNPLSPIHVAQWGLTWRIARRIAVAAGGGASA